MSEMISSNISHNFNYSLNLNLDDVLFKDSTQSAISSTNIDTFKKALPEISKNRDIPEVPEKIAAPTNHPATTLSETIETSDMKEEHLDISTSQNKVSQSLIKKNIPTVLTTSDNASQSLNTKSNFAFPETLPSVDFLTFNDSSPMQVIDNKEIEKEFQQSKDQLQVFDILERIPNRAAFKIGEVAFLTGIKSYVLRYWESEFEALRPKKATNNRRMYTRKDVKTILLIKKLLYKDKYSIEGAKKALKTLQTDIRHQHKTLLLSHKQKKAVEQIKDLIHNISHLKKSLQNEASTK